MITFLTLQCNLLWNDVMQAVVFSAEHISILMWRRVGSFIGGQELTVGFQSQVLQSEPLLKWRMLSREVTEKGSCEAPGPTAWSDLRCPQSDFQFSRVEIFKDQIATIEEMLHSIS